MTEMMKSQIRDLMDSSTDVKREELPKKVWNLNLDQIEPNTGKVIERVIIDRALLGPSVAQFDSQTILYSKLRPYLNKVVIADQPGFSTTELVHLRCNKNKVFPEFLAHYLRSQQFVRFASNVVAGAKMPRMVMSEFWSHEAPLPPLPEQRRIAQILDKAEALRSKRRAALAKLDKLAQSIFLEMFGDPVCNNMGWNLACLNDVSNLIQIGPFGTQLHEEDYVDDGIPLINPTHIKNGRIHPDRKLTISKSKHSVLVQYQLQQGDVIIGRRGEMGRCAIVGAEESGWLCGTGSLFVRVNTDILDPFFLQSVISSDSMRKKLENEAQGQTMANLNKNIIGMLQIAVPPIFQQRQYFRSITAIESLKAAHRASLTKLDALFASLQHRAFRGDL